jgi:two-component system sensor histidine kinase PilS (NtrC family)
MAGASGGSADGARQRLARLMAARLLIALAVFGLALVVVGAGREGAEAAERGLYGTLAAAFLATAVFAASLRFVRNLDLVAGLQVAMDMAIVTSVLVFSGGGQSIFSFLYLPITVWAAIWFDRRGGYVAALGACAAYGAALVLGSQLGGGYPLEVSLALFSLHAGALLLVAMLSTTLARELRVTGERLHDQAAHLGELRTLHARTVECLTSGLLTIDESGCITSFNPEAERITGHAWAEVLGAPLERVLPGSEELAARGPDGRGRARSRLVVSGPKGAEQHLGVSISTLRDHAGAPAGSVVIFQDVTRVVGLERDNERNARLAGVGQLAADMAHEVRNPLAAISGSVEMLRGGSHSPEDQQRLMDIVLREIRRLDALIADFLEYARPAPPKLEDIAVGPLLADLVEMASGGADAAVRIRCEVEDDLVAHTDSAQLRQVLWNLIRNAEQALGDGGGIELFAKRQILPQDPRRGDRNADEGGQPGVEITVSDDGRGMEPEVLERIFDPFFTTRPDGSGLGLATVHRIIGALGGEVVVESSPSIGTKVRIQLRADEVTLG